MSKFFTNINGEIKTPFRWYKSELLRNRYKLVCQKGCTDGILTPITSMLPFMLYRTKKIGGITSWLVKDLDGNIILDLASDISKLQIKYFVDYDYIIYHGDDLSQFLPAGFYESEISDGTNTWYSETFKIVCGSTGSNTVFNNSFDEGTAGWTLVAGSQGGIPGDDAGQVCFLSSIGCTMSQVNVFPTFFTPYLLTVVTANVTNGSITANCGNGDLVTISTSGVHKFVVTAADEHTLTFETADSFTGCVLEVTVEEIDPALYCRMKLTWKKSCGNLNLIYYETGFENVLYLDDQCEIIQPQSTLTQSGTENGEGEFIKDFQRRETEYRVALGMLPWYVVDSLLEMVLHDTVQLTLKSNLGVETLLNPRIEAEWNTAGDDCYALVNLFFKLDEYTFTDNCCNLFEETGDPCLGLEPEIQFSGIADVCEGTSISIIGSNIAAGQSSGNTYSWVFVSSGVEVSTTDTLNIANATGVNVGRYNLTITNQYGCSSTSFVDISVYTVPILTFIDKSDESSSGACDGSIVVEVTNVPGPILYSDGSNINFDGMFAGECAGSYNVQAVDGNSCVSNTLVIVVS